MQSKVHCSYVSLVVCVSLCCDIIVPGCYGQPLPFCSVGVRTVNVSS
jgi:hypothetical protein